MDDYDDCWYGDAMATWDPIPRRDTPAPAPFDPDVYRGAGLGPLHGKLLRGDWLTQPEQQLLARLIRDVMNHMSPPPAPAKRLSGRWTPPPAQDE